MATLEEVPEPYQGSLEKLSLNLFKTQLSVKSSASWACPIIGEYKVVDKTGSDPARTEINLQLNSFAIMDANECTMTVPMTFNRDIRNMTDHKVIIEVEASCKGDDLDLRAVLNVNAIDKLEQFSAGDGDSFCVKRFDVPIIKLR